MEPVTLARKLGTTAHLSCLRQSAKRVGLVTEKDLIDEAVARGCFHYMEQIGHRHDRTLEDANEQDILTLVICIYLSC